MANELKQSTSPHLLQHKDDPVEWHQWGKESLAEAQRANKPILLSIGYAACHSCHTMARESFADPATARLMNELFVNIKVDRDERPDIDEIYQACLPAFGSPGGWPATMFLTPAGDPFSGGTYFPREASDNRTSFVDVLTTAARVYKEMPERVVTNTTQVRETLDRWHNESRPTSELSALILDDVAKHVCTRFDVFNGGLTGTPKFPVPSLVELVWRAYVRTPLPQYAHAVETTLDNICQGGIYDHLGGGFARYTSDERWLHPRFEKMLSDNAQLIDLLTLVWQREQRPLYRNRVEETVGWVLREMVLAGGGFAASLDAESEGEEGRFYLWTRAEIDAALGKDAAFFAENYDVQPGGNWQGRNVLHRVTGAAVPPSTEGRLNALRSRLLALRSTRTPPDRDDTVLTAWNGLMIAALAQAGEVFARAEWQAAAVKAFWFIADSMAERDSLAHSQRSGTLGGAAFAEDYAHMTRAALALFETTGHRPYLERALHWVDALQSHFWSEKLRGYCLAAENAEPLIVRPRTVFDSIIPSANAVMIDSLTRLSHLTGNADLLSRANILIGTFAADALQSPLSAPTFFNGLDTFARATEIVIVGARDAPRVLAFRDVLRRVSMPEKIVSIVAQPTQLPEGHPARAVTPANDVVTVYVCRRGACSPPITDPVAFELQLKSRVVGRRPSADGKAT